MAKKSWIHLVCDECWEAKNPGRCAVRLKITKMAECCLCGEDTRSGIYVRIDPDDDSLRCNGIHGEEDESS